MISRWNGIRLFRIIIGAAAFIQGLLYRQYLLSAVGVILLLQGILNIGCCGTTCLHTQRKIVHNNSKDEVIDYEEINSSN